MADRPDHDLATELERSQNSYIAKMSDGHNSIIVRSKDDELAECYRLMGAAAARLRQLTDETPFVTKYVRVPDERDELRRQLDTLRNAIAAHQDCCLTDFWPELRDGDQRPPGDLLVSLDPDGVAARLLGGDA